MHPRDDFLRTPELDYEGWRDALRPDWGRYNPEEAYGDVSGRNCGWYAGGTGPV